MSEYKSAEAFIEILNAHGVDNIFINPGFEAIEVLTCAAQARRAGNKAPRLVLCLDESAAACAAYGSYMVTGKPQVVMVHAEIGSLQLGGNLLNLQWGRVPALILAAYQETGEQRKIWNGGPYDQGGIVRNSVKYDRALNGGEDLHEVLTQAFQIARSEPSGPVYISFPMDYLYGKAEKPDNPPVPAAVVPLPAVDMDKLSGMADILINAESPMLVSGSAGRYHENVEALVSLAQTLGASVLTGYSVMNFPSTHPLCLGIEQIGGSRKKDAGYDSADVILAIDYDMPYVGSAPPPRAEAKILHIDVDPLTQGRPLWGRGADIFIKADSREAIPAIRRLIEDKLTISQKEKISRRAAVIASENEKTRRSLLDSAATQAQQQPICADYLFYCLNQLIDEDTIVVNHTLSHCASVTEQIERVKPGTWFGCPSGAIGWAPGAALGAACAAQGKTVVAVMTDGGFVWGCPTSVFWTSANYGFPFLAIICNNNGYGAIRDVQREIASGAELDERFFAESAVDFSPDYAIIAQGAGAFGRTVTTPGEILPALREALDIVKSGRPAVLDIHLPKDRR